MNAFKTKLVALFIALSLCVTWFYFMREVAPGNRINTITPAVFASDVGGGMMVQPLRAGTNPVIAFPTIPTTNGGAYNGPWPKVWQSRIAGPWLAGQLLQRKLEPLHVRDTNGVAITGVMVKLETFRNVFGLYQAVWLMLTFIVLICFVENPAFIIPVVFAGACYTLASPRDVIMFPWDMPSMFFFTLACLLYMRGWFVWMLVTIVLGTAFKETVAVTAFLFFFTKLNWKQKAGFFGAAFVACLLLKLWITHAVMGHAQVFTADVSHGPPLLEGLKLLLIKLFTPHLNHFIWVNGGTFVVAMLLPMRTLVDKGTKFVLALFFAGMTLACYWANTYYEVRQFLDVLPVSVIYLSRTVEHWRRRT